MSAFRSAALFLVSSSCSNLYRNFRYQYPVHFLFQAVASSHVCTMRIYFARSYRYPLCLKKPCASLEVTEKTALSSI
jgi:hypothetical protein